MLTLDYRVYHRPFKQPLPTAHGEWTQRRGIILRLQAGLSSNSPSGSPLSASLGSLSGSPPETQPETQPETPPELPQIGFGEIAPLPWFGTEDLGAAIALCQTLNQTLSQTLSQALNQTCYPQQIAQIAGDYPASQFGLSSAWMQLQSGSLADWEMAALSPAHCCALLPTGTTALTAWPSLWQAGHRTFKQKIGVSAIAAEQDTVAQLVAVLPPTAKLRLDANGSLTPAQAQQWLIDCDRMGIEFLEQPLPPSAVSIMQRLSQHYVTPIALDESVATLAQIHACLDQGWSGVLVIKPAIAGNFSHLLATCRPHRHRIVVSSVFETAVGRQAVLQFAQMLYQTGTPPFALGLGTDHWFAADGFHTPPLTALWNRL